MYSNWHEKLPRHQKTPNGPNWLPSGHPNLSNNASHGHWEGNQNHSWNILEPEGSSRIFQGEGGGPLLLNAPRWIQSWSIWTHNASWCTPKCYKTMNPIPWKNIVGICFSFSASYVHDLCYFTIASIFWPLARTLHHKVPFVILKSSAKTSKVAS